MAKSISDCDSIVELVKNHRGGDLMAQRLIHDTGFDEPLFGGLVDECDLARVAAGADLSDIVNLSWHSGYWLAQVPVYGSLSWAVGLSHLDSRGARETASGIFKAMSTGGPVIQLVGSSGAAANHAGRSVKCDLVPYGAVARLFLVAVQKNEEIAIHAVSPDSEGVSVTPVPTMFSNASADVVMTSSAIEASEIVGTVCADSFNCAAMMTDLLRAAYIGGVMNACLDMAVAYVKARKQFGKALGTLQVVQHALADVDTEVNAIRRVLDYAQGLRVNNGNASYAYSAAAILARSGGVDASTACMHLFGGKGFLRDGPIEAYYRAAKQLRLEQGAGRCEAEQLASAFA